MALKAKKNIGTARREAQHRIQQSDPADELRKRLAQFEALPMDEQAQALKQMSSAELHALLCATVERRVAQGLIEKGPFDE